MEQLISIIVPVYNAEDTLNRCILSLIKQTYNNIEIILVNDGSTDSSLNICKKFQADDNRIKVIDKKNGGVSSARNMGLDVANGQFIMFCDSDDWAEPDWCEELYTHYEDNNLVMCAHYIEGEQSFIPHMIKSKDKYDIIKRQNFYTLKLCSFNAPWNKIFSTSIISQYNLRFDERITNGEDILFILQYLEKITGNIIFLNKCVFHYEWPQEQSLSRKTPDNYLDQCCLLSNAIFDLSKKIGLKNTDGWKQLKTDYFNEFQKIIISIINDKNTHSIKKIHKMSAVMKTREYQVCAIDANISNNKIYSYLARQKNAFGLWLWHQILK